jgi:hypothetical protein
LTTAEANPTQTAIRHYCVSSAIPVTRAITVLNAARPHIGSWLMQVIASSSIGDRASGMSVLGEIVVVGASSSRSQALGLQRLRDHLGDFSVEEHGVEWKQSITLRGPAKLPITMGVA